MISEVSETLSVCLRGGLGNNLFQIAAVYSYSLRDRMNFVVNPVDSYGFHFHYSKYQNNIFRNLNFIHLPQITKRINVAQYHYLDVPTFQESHQVEGYFQSEKYFLTYRKEILELLEMPDEIENKCKSLYPLITENQKNCSIHVRRGDYLALPNYHPILPLEYYHEAVSTFEDETVFLIFSDDINWCKENFSFIKNKIFVENLEDFDELYLMSLCKSNIIANSSFSWWGAWMNKNKEKRVICPQKWFGIAYDSYNKQDLIPQNWIKI